MRFRILLSLTETHNCFTLLSRHHQEFELTTNYPGQAMHSNIITADEKLHARGQKTQHIRLPHTEFVYNQRYCPHEPLLVS